MERMTLKEYLEERTLNEGHNRKYYLELLETFASDLDSKYKEVNKLKIRAERSNKPLDLEVWKKSIVEREALQKKAIAAVKEWRAAEAGMKKLKQSISDLEIKTIVKTIEKIIGWE